MTTWIEDVPAFDECAHEPNLRGTACQHCGLPAEMVTPDELVIAMAYAYAEARAKAEGQTSWLEQ